MSAPSKSDQNALPSHIKGAPLENRLQEIQARQEQLEQTIRQLREKVASLEAETKKLQIERDGLQLDCEDYQACLLDLFQKNSPVPLTLDDLLTRRKIAEMEATGVSFEDMMRELEAK